MPIARRLIVIVGAVSALSAACSLLVDVAGLSEDDVTSVAVPDAPPEATGDAADARIDVVADGAIVDPICHAVLATDSTNCGKCGHDCAGSTCSAGLCTPTVFVQSLASPHGIAIVNGSVFVAGGTSIYQFAMDGGGGVIAAVTDARFIDVSPTHVYWAEYGAQAIRRKPLAGGPVETIVPSVPSASGLALDGTKVYYSQYFSDAGKVWRAEGDGGAPTIVRPNESEPENVRVAGTVLYVADNGVPDAIVTYDNLGAGTRRIVTKNGGEQTDVRLDGMELFFVRQNGGEIVRIATDGGPEERLAASSSKPSGIALTATRIYWTNRTAGTVMSVAR